MKNARQRKTVAWQDDIIAVAGYWEPIAFTIRGGRAPRGIENDASPYSEEMARKLARIGVNVAAWHYYKGLGMKTEAPEMARTGEFFRHLEKHGIAKGVYINIGSFFADTFLAENPQAQSWLSRDQYGQPHQYSEFYRAYYRFRPCMSNLEFADYVGRAATQAIRDAGADFIFFDNSAQMPCYCERCRKGFPEYVAAKYPARAEKGRPSFKDRFGYDFTGRFELPRGTARMTIDTLPAAHEPGLYEWIRYRQGLYEAGFARAMKAIRAASKTAQVEWNMAFDYGEFVPLVWGLDPDAAWRCHSDFFFSEDGNHAGIEDGRLISHIRTYKYGRAVDNRVFVHNMAAGSEDIRYLNYAEAAAFNGGCLGHVMWATADEKDFGTLRRALDFFRGHRECYLKTRPLSQAALYRCSESEVGAWADASLARLAVEQVLLRRSVQYDCVINDRLEDIFNYPLLVCANTPFVSDAAVKLIGKYLKQGGKLLCTENSFRKDEYGRNRLRESDVGLEGERDAGLGRTRGGRFDPSAIVKRLGVNPSLAERIFYLPRLKYARAFTWDLQDSHLPIIGKEYFAEPLNADDLVGLIRTALPALNVELTAPANVLAGFFAKEDGGRVIHVLDYEANRTVSGAFLRFEWPKRKPRAALFHTMDATREVRVEWHDGFASCLVPDFRTYGMLEVNS